MELFCYWKKKIEMRNLNLIHLNGLRAVEAVGRLALTQGGCGRVGCLRRMRSASISGGSKSNWVANCSTVIQNRRVPTEAGERALPHLTAGMLELSKSIGRVVGSAGDPLVVSVPTGVRVQMAR